MSEVASSSVLWGIIGLCFGVLFEAMFGFARRLFDRLRGRHDEPTRSS